MKKKSAELSLNGRENIAVPVARPLDGSAAARFALYRRQASPKLYRGVPEHRRRRRRPRRRRRHVSQLSVPQWGGWSSTRNVPPPILRRRPKSIRARVRSRSSCPRRLRRRRRALSVFDSVAERPQRAVKH